MLSRYRSLIILTLAAYTVASSGDRSAEFQNCVIRCSVDTCVSSSMLPLALQLTRWNCADDCKYTCMHVVTNKAVELGLPIEQYYGKWPFWRFMGMQEPASVAFSLLNLWFHAAGFSKIRRSVPNGHIMKTYYLLWAIISMNTWVWSSIFHTRDLPTTEKLDYFSAALAIGYSLYYTVIRLFHLYPRRNTLANTSLDPKRTTRWIWSLFCVIIYVSHVSYLTMSPRFDYSYNIAFNLALGLTHNAIWSLYSLPSSFPVLWRFLSKPKSYRPAFAGKAAFFVLLTTAATALELFDFPPWGRFIDAHALWHLSTAPIIPFWYDFLVEDSLDDGWRGAKV
ncbi:Per1-like protein [Athelia psychrophila]|uniref:Post-GPI attachment to proteins factor 3 n=1 Tax=Athelia psychrophila TaxID=1759441 RepID=A0A166CMD7_9AGAM|nr:Per1-like protein [Fibularhizoctonia sp. CBS 109695]